MFQLGQTLWEKFLKIPTNDIPYTQLEGGEKMLLFSWDIATWNKWGIMFTEKKRKNRNYGAANGLSYDYQPSSQTPFFRNDRMYLLSSRSLPKFMLISCWSLSHVTVIDLPHVEQIVKCRWKTIELDHLKNGLLGPPLLLSSSVPEETVISLPGPIFLVRERKQFD